MDGLRTGRLDMAGLTLDEALTLVQEGIPIKVIWVLDISQGADALVARYGVAGLADLRGRKVGVEQTAVGAYMLNAALAKAGLRTTDITVVPLPLDEHLTAWRESQVDALVTFDPVLQVLRGEGAPVLFDSSAIPGEIVDVLVARTDALACCTQRISQLLAAHERALAHLGTARRTLCGAWRPPGPHPDRDGCSLQRYRAARRRRQPHADERNRLAAGRLGAAHGAHHAGTGLAAKAGRHHPPDRRPLRTRQPAMTAPHPEPAVARTPCGCSICACGCPCRSSLPVR